MKVVIKSSINGVVTRVQIDFQSESLIGDLRSQISRRLSVALSQIQLTTKKNGLLVLMTDSWPLSFFVSSEKAVIKVNYLESSTNKDLSPGLQSSMTRSRGVTREVPAIEQLISISKSGNMHLLSDFFECFEQEIRKEELLNQVQESRWGALHYACYFGHTEMVTVLVNQLVNVNSVTIDEWTPLQLSCYFRRAYCVKALLQHPSLQINKSTRFRGTGLHLACLSGSLEITRLLLDRGAEMNIEDHVKRTPILYAKTGEVRDLLAEYNGKTMLQRSKENAVKPTPFCSEVYMLSSFMLNDKYLFLYMDVEGATLNRYVKKEDFLDKKPAEHYTKISEIQEVLYTEAKDQYQFKINTQKVSIKYYSKHKEIAQEWTNRLKLASEYFLVNKPAESERKTNEVDDEAVQEESAANPHETIDFNSFTILDEIGSGSFGTVYKVKKNNTGELYAMKSLSKPSLQKQKQLKYAISECKIMKQLDHPFIVPLHYAFQTPKYLYLVLELCTNGDLYGFIEKKKKLDEAVCRFYLAEVILALEYLHSIDIIYRDLKPANVLIDQFGHAKLADFGLAKQKVDHSNLAMTMAGSPAYLPPEIVMKKGASKASDIYGLGPLLYELLTGTTPYYCDDIDGLFQNIKSGKLSFPSYVSCTAKEFITIVMNRDPAKRPQYSQIKRHPFFRKMDWEALLAKRIRAPKLDFVNFEDY